MILLDDFVKDLKRVNQFGNEDVTDDEPTADILRWTNNFKVDVAAKGDWSWLLKTFTVDVVSGEQTITVDSTINRIVAIKGAYARLRKVSVKQAMDWHTPAVQSSASADNSLVGWYTDMGVDATTGAKKIRVYGLPGASASLTAYGLQAVEAFTLADIAAQSSFLPFPDAVVNRIADLVSSRIQKFKGNSDWAAQERLAWNNVLLMFGDEQSDPADDVTTPLPPYYRKRRAFRRNGSVA